MRTRRSSASQTRVSVLFSEPKIPQPGCRASTSSPPPFQCSSASRKFLKPKRESLRLRRPTFQCSSASRKFLKLRLLRCRNSERPVSVLFSEPKIPQPTLSSFLAGIHERFSALQRAENSSTERAWRLRVRARVSVLFSEPKIPQVVGRSRQKVLQKFQCSSASRKFLNKFVPGDAELHTPFQCSSASRKFLNIRAGSDFINVSSFSALQRAENSSNKEAVALVEMWQRFQCSSASRKFLNVILAEGDLADRRFSALQRAENSSTRPSHLRPSIFPTAMITLRHS